MNSNHDLSDQVNVHRDLGLQKGATGAPSVMIGVVNYNRPVDTIECLRSLLNCSYPNKELVLFDNGSEDDSVQRIRDVFPSLTILESRKNLGAAGARNQVIRWVQNKNPDYLLMLDNDTVVERGFLTPLVEAMENDTDAAVACGTILEFEHPDVIWFGGGRLVPLRGLALHERAGRIFCRGDEGGPKRVSYITVCVILFRYPLLDRIGPLDERYFVYLEDIEFAVRLHKQGYKQLYVPSSVIYHKVQGEHDSTFKLYYCVRNRMLLTREGFGGLVGTIATVYFLAAIAVKLAVWRVLRPDFYLAAKAGLRDYFKGNFGEGKGINVFSDDRTKISMSGRSVTTQESKTS
jgi:GT2 family glycosyltransferase